MSRGDKFSLSEEAEVGEDEEKRVNKRAGKRGGKENEEESERERERERKNRWSGRGRRDGGGVE